MSEQNTTSTGNGGSFKDNSARNLYAALQKNPTIVYDPDDDEVSESEYFARKKQRAEELAKRQSAETSVRKSSSTETSRTAGTGRLSTSDRTTAARTTGTARTSTSGTTRTAGNAGTRTAAARTAAGSTSRSGGTGSTASGGKFANRNAASSSGSKAKKSEPAKLTDRELYQLVKTEGHRPLTDREKSRYKGYKRRKKRIKKGRKKFFIFLGIYAFIIAILGTWFLIYVNKCLKKYEASQDYNAIGTLVSDFTNKVKDGTVTDIIEIPDDSCKFEAKDTFLQLYLEKLQANTNFTYEKNKQSYDSSAPVYDIKQGDELIARMTLKAENAQSVLGILSVCDWSIDHVSPALSVTTSTYRYTMPENYKLVINGIEATAEDQTGDPVANTYDLNEEIFEYISFPATVTYEISGLVAKPTVEIYDENGDAVSFTEAEDGSVTISSEPDTSQTIPDDRKSFALEAAEAWADFTNLDLPGDNLGVAKMVTYFIKDSFYYQQAYDYLTCDARYTISDHTSADPKFSDITVDEYTVYSDQLYSCHIKFDKNMYTKGHKFKHITVDSTFYFLYWDDSDDGEDNPEWHIIDMVATTNNDTTDEG